MANLYKHLTQEERDVLAVLRGQGASLRSIARTLGRSPGTLSRELQRNAPLIRSGYYLPHKAQARADQRKGRGHPEAVLKSAALRAYVARKLPRGWSPERIAGRRKRLKKGAVSYEAIYQWIYAKARHLIPCLVRGHRKRLRRGHSSKHKTSHIPSRTSIRMRPQRVQRRRQAGHWEVDTLISRKSRAALQILVERKTRYTRLKKLRTNGADEMRRSMNQSLSRYPTALRRSITYDNGSENVQHMRTNRVLGTQSFFCEPFHSWEKGSVENAGGLVRRLLPKKTDFAKVSSACVKRTERWLNSLPKKCLGFKTAAEAFRQCVALRS